MSAYVNKNVKPNNQRKRALAFLEQAEDFYQSASAPRLGSRPLLYYYSFMNLAKAFLVVRRNLDLTKCIHGLKEGKNNVRQRLTITSQNVKIDDQSIKRTQIYREFVAECGFSIPKKPKPMKLVDLLEQVVGVHQIVCQTLNRKQRFFPTSNISFEFNPNGKQVWVTILAKRSNLAGNKNAPKAIRDNMASFEEVESFDRSYRRYESKVSKPYSRSPQDVLKGLVEETKKDIWSLLRPGRYQFYISSIPRHMRLAQVASYYQGMFYFGSLTRYRPDDFIKLAEGKHGWLVHEFVGTQALQFIYLLGSGLIGSEMVVPETANA